jgi:hypothetical protein
VMHLPVRVDHQSILQEIYRVLHLFAKQNQNQTKTGYFIKQNYCIHFGQLDIVEYDGLSLPA